MPITYQDEKTVLQSKGKDDVSEILVRNYICIILGMSMHILTVTPV